MTSPEASVCPLCGQVNRCELEEGRRSCWCFEERVDPELVEWLAQQGIEGRCLCRACATEGVRSPCVQDCRLDPATQTCQGCRRTVEEITAWSRMDSVARARVHLRLQAQATTRR